MSKIENGKYVGFFAYTHENDDVTWMGIYDPIEFGWNVFRIDVEHSEAPMYSIKIPQVDTTEELCNILCDYCAIGDIQVLLKTNQWDLLDTCLKNGFYEIYSKT